MVKLTLSLPLLLLPFVQGLSQTAGADEIITVFPAPIETFEYRYATAGTGKKLRAFLVPSEQLPLTISRRKTGAQGSGPFVTPRLEMAPSRSTGVARHCRVPVLLAKDESDRRRALSDAALLDGNVIAIDGIAHADSDMVVALTPPLPVGVRFNFVIARPSLKGTWTAVNWSGWELLVAVISKDSPRPNSLRPVELKESGTVFVSLPAGIREGGISALHIRPIDRTNSNDARRTVLFLDNISLLQNTD